jgi:hypothetical protein
MCLKKVRVSIPFGDTYVDYVTPVLLAYVALSRATSLENLEIQNFQPAK